MSGFANWRAPSAPVAPSRDTVQIWRLRLDVAPDAVRRLAGRLSVPEREQVERFRVERKRREFAVTRGRLREILGAALGADPRAVAFAHGKHGKPRLAGENPTGVAFNVSHSHDLALIAVGAGREIGVDVEKVRSRVEYAKVARRFFSPEEVARLMALPDDQRRAGFFNCWSRKEAVIKAVGRGIGLGLDRFDVSLAPGEPAALLATRWDPAAAARWRLVELDMDAGYAGAVAVEGGGVRILGWDERAKRI